MRPIKLSQLLLTLYNTPLRLYHMAGRPRVAVLMTDAILYYVVRYMYLDLYIILETRTCRLLSRVNSEHAYHARVLELQCSVIMMLVLQHYCMVGGLLCVK